MAAYKEQNNLLEEKKVMDNIIVEENRLMMIDLSEWQESLGRCGDLRSCNGEGGSKVIL